jgi:hypothetical protein
MAGIAGDRREPGEACHAFILDRAEFGHLDEQDQGRDFANSWNAPGRRSGLSGRGRRSTAPARAASIAASWRSIWRSHWRRFVI